MDGVIQLSNNRSQNVILKYLDSCIHVGGTLDVTVHELMENGAIRELYKATGGTFGGQKDSSGSFLNKFSPNPSSISICAYYNIIIIPALLLLIKPINLFVLATIMSI